MEHGYQIGKFRVVRDGRHWVVLGCSGPITIHDTKWLALKAARSYNWRAKNEPADPGGHRDRRATH